MKVDAGFWLLVSGLMTDLTLWHLSLSEK